MCNIEIKDLTETTDLDRTVMAKIQGMPTAEAT
jgi:hypothetical protein